MLIKGVQCSACFRVCSAKANAARVTRSSTAVTGGLARLSANVHELLQLVLVAPYSELASIGTRNTALPAGRPRGDVCSHERAFYGSQDIGELALYGY